jgi:outer membrane receptor protein involved in Fe transport
MKRSNDVKFPQAKTGVLLLGLLVGVSGCSTSGPAGTDGRGGARNQITAEQIAELPAAVGTAYNIIAQLRPRWLRASRSQGTPGGGPALPVIFVDQTAWGDIGSLEGISLEEVERIEFLDMRDATIQYGTGYPGGIIRIVTRRGR